MKYSLMLAVVLFVGCGEITETLKEQVDQGVQIGEKILQDGTSPNSQLAKDNYVVHLSIQGTVGKPEADIPYTPEAVADNADDLEQEAKDRGWLSSVLGGIKEMASVIPGWGWLASMLVGGVEFIRRYRKKVRLARGIVESVNVLKERAEEEGDLTWNDITTALKDKQDSLGIRDEVRLMLKEK